MFDVRLKDLMNLEKQSENFSKLHLLFTLLDHYWYNIGDKSTRKGRKDRQERRNQIRIGSVSVFLDDDGALHLDFCTRFSFKNDPSVLEFLDQISNFEDSNKIL
jgi:hypothetical protein